MGSADRPQNASPGVVKTLWASLLADLLRLWGGLRSSPFKTSQGTVPLLQDSVSLDHTVLFAELLFSPHSR